MGFLLDTERLVIRSFEPQDADSWLAMVSTAEFNRFLPTAPPPTIERFGETLRRRVEMERTTGFTVWAAALKESGTLIGQSGFALVEGTGPEVELVYHFATEFWGRGYATEAASAVLAYGFENLGLERVIALVVPENVPSCRVAEKAGLCLEGTASYYELPVLKVFAADRESWQARRK